MGFTTSPEFKKDWKEKYNHLIGQYYSDHFCHCGNQCKIKIIRSHKHNGIPKFLTGHNIKGNGKSPMLRPEVAAKLSATKKGTVGHLHTGISIEWMKYIRGTIIPGPPYWKSMEDLAREGARLYKMKKSTIRRSILRILKLKNLTELDIVLLMNWMIGHNFEELSRRYYLTLDEVLDSLKKMEKTYKGITMSGKSVPDNSLMWSVDILYRMEADIKYRF